MVNLKNTRKVNFRLKIICLNILLASFFSCSPDKEPHALADPFVGTGGHGHTFPGATAPFGMIQLSPDTRLEGWDGCSGYHYSDSLIYGFSMTHLSGTGVSDYGDFLLVPQTGKLLFNPGSDGKPGYLQGFSHDLEEASPGHYGVHLESGIEVELAAIERAGIMKLRYPEEGSLLLDLGHRDSLIESWIEMADAFTLKAYRRSTAWAKDQRLWFMAKLNQPVRALQLEGGKSLELKFPVRVNEKKLALMLDPVTREVEVQVAISAVDSAGARKNLESLRPGADFKTLLARSKESWKRLLGKIKVEGGSPANRRAFYSALYHSTIAPNLYSDVDGRYRGRDMAVHQGKQDQYTVFSLWDTYRALHPLLTILEPERTGDFLQTMLRQYEEGGALPVWELAACETHCMIGYHAVPVLADALMKGLEGFDAELALEASVHSAQMDHFGLHAYRENRFIPAELEPESVSKTLEYAYDDWCIARMAEKLGKDSIVAVFDQRAQYWKNLFDPETGFFRPKVNQAFVEPFDPFEVNFHFTEANAWQYSMYVPQDVEGYRTLLGGPDSLEARLDRLFSASTQTTGRNQADITGLIGQYAHGNEPSQHMAYLYTYTNSPWKTQDLVRRILTELYSDAPDGLPGNEDCGQMSAWYVLSALGFYPVCPGSNQYTLGAPLFDQATISLGNGSSFLVRAKDLSVENRYIQRVLLNGVPLERAFIWHEEVTKGGELEFQMGSEPSEWGKGTVFSSQKPDPIVVNPRMRPFLRTFDKEVEVELLPFDSGNQISYSMNGGKKREYEGPITLSKDADLVFSASGTDQTTPELKARLTKRPGWAGIKIRHPYAPQYAAGGSLALINGLEGGPHFAGGDWQGYYKENLEAVVDLGSEQQVQQVEVNFFQDWNSWIYLPTQVQFFSSLDSQVFNLEKVDFNLVDPKEPGGLVQAFRCNKSFRARYIKVIGFNRGVNPPWHRAPGDPSWIFADEIRIRTSQMAQTGQKIP